MSNVDQTDDGKLFQYDVVYDKEVLSQVPQKTIIATTTMYKDMHDKGNRLRSALAHNMVQKACNQGYEVIIVDAGSDPGWRNAVKDLGAIVLDEKIDDIPGAHPMGRSRRQALTAAGNHGSHKVIVWTEAEKHPMIVSPQGTYPLATLGSVIYQDFAELAVPRRMDQLESYPSVQRIVELQGNLRVYDLIKKYVNEKQGSEVAAFTPYLDLWVGVRAMNRNTLDNFLAYHGKVGETSHDQWEMLFVVPVDQLLNGKKVVSVPVNYVHPRKQKEFEEGRKVFDDKREKQFNLIIQSIEELLLLRKKQGILPQLYQNEGVRLAKGILQSGTTMH